MYDVFAQLLISMLPALYMGVAPAPAAANRGVVRVAASDTGPSQTSGPSVISATGSASAAGSEEQETNEPSDTSETVISHSRRF